jgi:hypothetical protein
MVAPASRNRTRGARIRAITPWLDGLRKNSGFVSGYRFSDTASFEINRTFRGRASKFDFFRSLFDRPSRIQLGHPLAA